MPRLTLYAVAATILCLCVSAAAGPKRVVSTFLCTDEYVFRLVPRDRIAALSYEATDRHPVVSTIADAAADIPTIHPTAETVLALHPDLVVMYAGVNQRLRDTLKRMGIRVLDVPWANSIADIRKTALMLGEALGSPQKAHALVAQMDATLAQARAQAPHPPVTTILYQPNGYALSSGYTLELMATAGLQDVTPASALSRTGRLPVEAIVTKAPQLLILGGEEKSGTALAYQILHHPALKTVPSHTEFSVLTELMCPGPWSADAATRFSHLARKALAQKPAGH